MVVLSVSLLGASTVRRWLLDPELIVAVIGVAG